MSPASSSPKLAGILCLLVLIAGRDTPCSLKSKVGTNPSDLKMQDGMGKKGRIGRMAEKYSWNFRP